MSVFQYQARTKEGEMRSGNVEAPSLEVAIDVLQRNQLIIVDVRAAASAGIFSREKFKFFERVKQKDIVLFSRQLATLFEARVPVVQALKTLITEYGSEELREALGMVLDDVNGGASLSLAMSKHPYIFSPFYISMVRSGEESGQLQEVFTYLADYLERSYALTSKAKNALIYPAFVFASFIGVIVVMLVVVIPRLTSIFEETQQAVPLYTQIVIAASNFLRSWGWALLVALGTGAVFAWRYLKTDQGRIMFDEFQLKVPIMGELYKKIYLTRFADNLGTLILAGLPILRALQITSEVVGNRIYERAILQAIESVRGGSTIASALQGSQYIPGLVTQMIRIGEEAGRLDSILKNIARFYQRDVDNLLENLVSLIEPALIIFLGIAVGGLVVSILVPLYNLSNVF